MTHRACERDSRTRRANRLMPATFAHPAAVLPFRVFGKRWFNFAALVIGSVTPDFAYFIRRFDVATYAHSLSGTIFFCVPVGLARVRDLSLSARAALLRAAGAAPICVDAARDRSLPPNDTEPSRSLALCSARSLDAYGGGLVHAQNRLGCPTSAVDAEDALSHRRGRLSGAPAFATRREHARIDRADRCVCLWLRRQPRSGAANRTTD